MIILKPIFTRPIVVPIMRGRLEGIQEHLTEETGVSITDMVLYLQNGVIRCCRSDVALNRA